MSDAAPRARWKTLALWGVGLLAAVGLWALGRLAPVDEWFAAVEELGPWGPAAIVALYVATCVLFVPGTILTLGAGALFGFTTGSIAAVIGSNLGANAAFLIARYVARSKIEGVLSGNAKLRALDGVVAREGFLIVFLTRLSPVFPFNALNYAYGLTSVAWRKYALMSLVGMLPGTLAYVYLGSVGRAVAGSESGERGALEWTILIVGVVATLALAAYIARIARGKLDERLDSEESSE